MQEVTRAANATDSVVDAGRVALAAVCRLTGWPLGHLLVPADDGTDDYVSSGVWHPDPAHGFAELREVSAAVRFPSGGGMVGRVRVTGVPAWIYDIGTDPLFIRNRFGRPLEAVSAFAFPVLSARGVAAVLEFFSPVPVGPDERLLEVVADVGTQLGRVIDRLDARLELEASKRRLEQIIETSAEAFVGMDEAGLITDWNAAAERMFGIERADAIRRSLAETVVPPRYRDAHRHGVERFLATGERRVLGQRVEISAWHRGDEREFPVEMATWATRDGDRWTFSAFLHDISERRRAEGERERLLVEQKMLLDSSSQGIFRLDRNGYCTYANPAAAQLLGWRADELIGLDMHALTHHHRADGRPYPWFECPVGEVLRGGQAVRVDKDLMWRRDGTSFPTEYSCAPIIGAAGTEGVVVLFTDISERRAAERSLRLAYEHERVALAKLKELDDAKTNFLATVSHELRTPLTSLAGFLELLIEGDVGEVSAPQHRVLETMSRSADRLRALIEDLLTVSNVEARPLVLRPRETDLAELLAEAAALVAEAAQRRDHELRVRVEPSIGPVRADPAQLRRVLTSLIDNAVKCTPDGGVIEIRADAADGHVEISVSDNGIGIDPDEVPRLFTRFFRTSAATQLAIQGAGLSLAIARQIIDGHGGHIDVRTAPGEGATFTVSLPAEVTVTPLRDTA
nr:PAS domain S-box protein [Planosporangium mesophilum]